jgi:hypothetical protein
LGDAGAEVTLLVDGLDGGCGPVLVTLARIVAGEEAAPQPVTNAAAMTPAASGADPENLMPHTYRSGAAK